MLIAEYGILYMLNVPKRASKFSLSYVEIWQIFRNPLLPPLRGWRLNEEKEEANQKQPPKRSSRDFQKIFVPRMLPRNLALRTSKSYNSFSLCLACCIYPLFLEGKSTFVFCLLSGHEAIIFPHAEGFFCMMGKSWV